VGNDPINLIDLHWLYLETALDIGYTLPAQAGFTRE